MNNYEMMYICDPSNEDGIEDIKKRIEGIITGHEGQVVSYEKLGKKRLAYPIQKRLYGMYFLVLFQGDGRIIHALDYFLRLNAITIRHLILNMSEKQLRLRDLTEKIKREEDERMRRGGRPMETSTDSKPDSVTPEKAAVVENESEQTSSESASTEETKKPETESQEQEVVAETTDTKAVTEETDDTKAATEETDVKDSEQDTKVETDQPEAQSNETADKTEPLPDEVEKPNEKTME